jgi:hypothetical protein
MLKIEQQQGGSNKLVTITMKEGGEGAHHFCLSFHSCAFFKLLNLFSYTINNAIFNTRKKEEELQQQQG